MPPMTDDARSLTDQLDEIGTQLELGPGVPWTLHHSNAAS